MIKSFTVINSKDESLVLELANPEPSGLIVQSITGLGSVSADVNLYDLATADGGIFTGSRVPSRDIQITLAMMFSPQIEDSRLKMYRYFPIKKKITFIVETDNRRLKGSGYVADIDTDIFNKTETATISITCSDPWFYSVDQNTATFTSYEPKFEFIFSNEDLSEPLLEIGAVNRAKRANCYYSGDIDTGVLINIHLYGEIKDFKIYNASTLERISLDTDKIKTITGKTLKSSDDIYISTITGSKYARLLRDGIYYNIIAAVDRDSDWFKLSPGDNVFTFDASYGADDMLITFEYQDAYGGI